MKLRVIEINQLGYFLTRKLDILYLQKTSFIVRSILNIIVNHSTNQFFYAT